MSQYTLGIIGGGNMAEAVVTGVIKFVPADKIIISDVDAAKLTKYSDKGIAVTVDNKEVAQNSDYVLFAVKPQFAPPVFAEISGLVASRRVISIMAGVKISAIESALPGVKVARVMPNTPCMLGKGMSALSFDGYGKAEKAFVTKIFKSLGEAVEVDESKMDAVTSVSGSGPAYVYMFMQAMTEGGMEGGLTYAEARMLAAQTLIGGAEMAKTSDNIGALIDAVCSKGGTTIQAVEHFRENDLIGIIKKGMEKCRNRSIELGKPVGGDSQTPGNKPDAASVKSTDNARSGEGGKPAKGDNPDAASVKPVKKKAAKKLVTVYTDGACSGNPGAGGYGAILIYNSDERAISGGERLTTNNRMEMTAVIAALNLLKEPCKVKIYSDSAYVVNAVSEGWVFGWRSSGWRTAGGEDVKNRDLWEKLLALLSTHETEFLKVKGHSDNEYNNRCDVLARNAAKAAAAPGASD